MKKDKKINMLVGQLFSGDKVKKFYSEIQKDTEQAMAVPEADRIKVEYVLYEHINGEIVEIQKFIGMAKK